MTEESSSQTAGRGEPRIRVLVVDDSPVVRKALTLMLESDDEIEVVGTARDGEEGIEKVRRLRPDLVTMDIEMPRMDGLTALREIMLTAPVPVMMVSSMTEEGADATFEALDLGAVDFIPKGKSYISLDILKLQDGLLARVKAIARRRDILMARARLRLSGVARPSAPRLMITPTTSDAPLSRRRRRSIGLIAIGSSTGGPSALQEIVPRLPRNLPVGVVIAQHMPAMFTKILASRLDAVSDLSVREAVDGERVDPGYVLIAPGGRHLTVRKQSGFTYAVVSDKPADTLYKPCVDVLLNSTVDTFGHGVLGVILTGMGTNGVAGFQRLHQQGGQIIAQDEGSCVVFGMPRAVIKAGLANHVCAIENMAAYIISYF